MIHTGDTIVYKVSETHYMFYWLCDIRADGYVFFNWYGIPHKAEYTDFWKMSKGWFNDRIADGTIEVYESLPLDKYGDIFEQQAIERSNG